MDFHIFEQRMSKDGKETVKWFYTFKDPVTNKMRTRICRGCCSNDEAKIFVSKLKYLSSDQYLIKNIAMDMFIPGKEHMNRLASFGKKRDERTVKMSRYYIKRIIADFGTQQIQTVKVSDIERLLLNDCTHSGSWKNQYLEAFCKIYDETQWVCSKPVARPLFMKFARNSKKADILTTEELNLFVSRRFWERERDYVLFLVVASCGLRLGEARGLRAKQFLFDKKILVIDGFCKRNDQRTNYNKTGSNENKKIRIAPLPAATLRIVKNYIETYCIGQDDFLFMMNGHPLRQEYLRAVFNRVLKASGIQTDGRKIVPHSLRFTYITRMRRNLDIETVKKIAGHASLEMTEYYTRFGIAEAFESVKKSIPTADSLFM